MVKFNKKIESAAEDKTEDDNEKKTEVKTEKKETQKPIDSEKTLDAIDKEKAAIQELKMQSEGFFCVRCGTAYPGRDFDSDCCPECELKDLKEKIKEARIRFNPVPEIPIYGIKWLIQSASTKYKKDNKRPRKCPKCHNMQIDVDLSENKATCRDCGNVFIAGACAGQVIINEVSKFIVEFEGKKVTQKPESSHIDGN